jgi:hypothetical protein
MAKGKSQGKRSSRSVRRTRQQAASSRPKNVVDSERAARESTLREHESAPLHLSEKVVSNGEGEVGAQTRLDRWTVNTPRWIIIALFVAPWFAFVTVNHKVFAHHRFVFISSSSYIFWAILDLGVILWGLYILIKSRASRAILIAIVIAVANAIVIDFAYLYYILGIGSNFSQHLSHLDAVYLSLGIFTTAGSGSIYPASELTRGLVIIQYIIDVVFFSALVNLLVSRLSRTGKSAE